MDGKLVSHFERAHAQHRLDSTFWEDLGDRGDPKIRKALAEKEEALERQKRLRQSLLELPVGIVTKRREMDEHYEKYEATEKLIETLQGHRRTLLKELQASIPETQRLAEVHETDKLVASGAISRSDPVESPYKYGFLIWPVAPQK